MKVTLKPLEESTSGNLSKRTLKVKFEGMLEGIAETPALTKSKVYDALVAEINTATSSEGIKQIFAEVGIALMMPHIEDAESAIEEYGDSGLTERSLQFMRKLNLL